MNQVQQQSNQAAEIESKVTEYISRAESSGALLALSWREPLLTSSLCATLDTSDVCLENDLKSGVDAKRPFNLDEELYENPYENIDGESSNEKDKDAGDEDFIVTYKDSTFHYLYACFSINIGNCSRYVYNL